MCQLAGISNIRKSLASEAESIINTMAAIGKVLGQGANGAMRASASPNITTQRGTKAKPNEVLKPLKLTKDHTPVELASWTETFHAYFSSSNFSTCTNTDHQEYFKSFIDVSLETRIKDRILPETPVFSDRANISSCMSILEEEFDSCYPIFSRRYTLFNKRQAEGQLFSDFAADVRVQADRARLHQLTQNNLVMLIYITGCRDTKLREDFLKEKEPTLRTFHEPIRQHEAANFAFKTISSKQDSQGHKEEARMTCAKQMNAPTIAELKASNRCTRCGKNNHDSRSCTHINAICNGCGVKGHLRRLCQKSHKPQQKTQSNNTPTAKQKVCQMEEKDNTGHESPPPGYSSDSDTERDRQGSYAKAVWTSWEYARTVRRGEDPRINLSFQHSNGEFMFEAVADTGTTKTIISRDVAKKYDIKMYSTTTKLRNASDEPMRCKGRAPNRINGIPTVALISSSLKGYILLSLKDMRKLGIVAEDFPALPQAARQAKEGSNTIVEMICREFPE